MPPNPLAVVPAMVAAIALLVAGLLWLGRSDPDVPKDAHGDRTVTRWSLASAATGLVILGCLMAAGETGLIPWE